MSAPELLPQTTSAINPALLLDILGQQPISFHRCYVQLTNSVIAALWLSYAVYHVLEQDYEIASDKDNKGWFSKSQLEWQQETGLTRREQESARKNLINLGVLEVKQPGMNQPLQFRINMDLLMRLLDDQAQTNTSASMSLGPGPWFTETGWSR